MITLALEIPQTKQPNPIIPNIQIKNIQFTPKIHSFSRFKRISHFKSNSLINIPPQTVVQDNKINLKQPYSFLNSKKQSHSSNNLINISNKQILPITIKEEQKLAVNSSKSTSHIKRYSHNEIKSITNNELNETNHTLEEDMTIHKPNISCIKKLICDCNCNNNGYVLPSKRNEQRQSMKIIKKNIEFYKNKKQFEMNQEQQVGTINSYKKQTMIINNNNNEISKSVVLVRTRNNFQEHNINTQFVFLNNKNRTPTPLKYDNYFLSMFSYNGIFIKKIKETTTLNTFIYSYLSLGDLFKKCLFINKKVYKETLKYIFFKLKCELLHKYINKNDSYNKSLKKLLIKKPKSELQKNIDEIYFNYYRSNSKYEMKIASDITRTFPLEKSFKKNGSLYRPLSNLLHTYSLFKPQIGYTQGLNFLFGNCLFLFDDLPSVFFYVHGMIKRLQMKSIFSYKNNSLSYRINQLGTFLLKNVGDVFIYLKDNYVNHEFFTTNWVLTLFSNGMKRNLVFIVWDFMIVFGWDFFDFFVVEMLNAFKKEIFDCNVKDLSKYMRDLIGMKEFEQKFMKIVEKVIEKMFIEKCNKMNI